MTRRRTSRPTPSRWVGGGNGWPKEDRSSLARREPEGSRTGRRQAPPTWGCRARLRAAVMITSETTTLGPVTEPLGGLSFLFHKVVLLRYIELESEIRRALSVVKMRDSSHAKDLRQFEVDERGFTVLGKLEGLTGILGWSALRAPEHPS
jgi:hypothetical protein